MEQIKKFGRSFVHAFHGFKYALRKEQNLRVELLAAIFVFATMLILPLEKWERVVLVLMIALVLVLEMLNTFVERLINLLKPRVHPQARVLKDIMASTVFLAAVLSAIVGLMIFWQYIG
jgi:undecaprenol kinase